MKHFYTLKINPKIWMLFSALFLTFFVFQVSAQTVERLDDVLVQETGNAKYIKNLFTKQYSTISIDAGEINTRGNGSLIILNTDIKDLNLIYTNNPLFSEVELIQIKISDNADLNKSVDFSQLADFSNLVVINVVFTNDVCGDGTDSCLKNKVQEMTQENNEIPALITYKLSLPN